MRAGIAGLIVALSGVPTAAGSAQGDGWRTDFSKHTVPLDQVVPGGPPKDGIPAIDKPRFVGIAAADQWLDDREPVIVVTVGAEARAYPLQILIWHEIVNDVVGDVPLAVTFCPLCNTALAFDRRVGARVLDFGTTGRLRYSDLVMYDRQTESWWQQATGEAIVGTLAGARLTFLGAPTVSWHDFKAAHPEGRVLSRDTGYDRPYGRSPYAGYDTRRDPLDGFFDRRPDSRLPAMSRVVAVEIEGTSVACPFADLARRRVVHDRVGRTPIVVFWAPGTASPLDAEPIAQGRDVGATGVFERVLDRRTLHFQALDDGQFRDRETGSRWDLLGRAVAGPLAGRRLTLVPHGNHFWFAWAAFRPGTAIRCGAARSPLF